MLFAVLLWAFGCPSDPGETDNGQPDEDVGVSEDVVDDTGGDDAGDDRSPAVDITAVPADAAPFIVDDDGFEFEFDVTDCDDCSTECAFGTDEDELNDELTSCDSPVGYSRDDVDGDGDHHFLVELIDDGDSVDDDRAIADIFEPDFGLEQLEEGQTVTDFVHGEYTPWCDREDCDIRCEWDGHQSFDCAAGQPLRPELPEHNSTLLIDACPQETDADESCLQLREYHFEYTEPQWDVVSSGTTHTCGILDDATLWCWGDGGDGRLGIGDTDSVDYPRRVMIDDDTQPDWLTVAAGGEHTCAITAESNGGELYCWGNADDGRLGIGDVGDTDTTRPVAIDEGSGWTDLSVGGAHSCALHGDELHCWGDNHQGQLGTGNTNAQLSPHQVEEPEIEIAGNVIDFPGWQTVSTGSEHTCAATFDDTGLPSRIYCWGNANDGRLGHGADTDREDEPVHVEGVSDVVDVTAGHTHSCALEEAGGGRDITACWGNNEQFQLGLGDDADDSYDSPRFIDNSDGYTAITAGHEHTCAIDTGDDPEVYCWGYDTDLQIGAETPPPGSPDPMSVDTDRQLDPVSAGGFHNCGIADGDLLCWGNGSDGQLGTGDSEDVPTTLNWPFISAN